MPKMYFGQRGGMYYKKGGRKVYVSKNRFGSGSNTNIVQPHDSTHFQNIIDTINAMEVNDNEFKEIELNLNCFVYIKTKEDKKKYNKLIKFIEHFTNKKQIHFPNENSWKMEIYDVNENGDE